MQSPEKIKQGKSKPVNVTKELAKAQRKLARINRKEQERKTIKQRAKLTRAFTGFVASAYESVTGEKLDV